MKIEIPTTTTVDLSGLARMPRRDLMKLYHEVGNLLRDLYPQLKKVDDVKKHIKSALDAAKEGGEK